MIEIRAPGLQTTVQDGGRPGYQSSGVPVCGAMDADALWRANLLCGNEKEEAALEICALGPELIFHESNIFALCGGRFDASLDGVSVEEGRAYLAHAGSTLKVGGAREGFRAVLAFAGGLELPSVMGSRSTCTAAHFGGLDGRRLQAGDRIAFRAPQLWLRGLPQRVLKSELPRDVAVRVVVGAQSELLEDPELFFEAEYRVSEKSDRMGLRLEGPALTFKKGHDANIISDGVAMGAIQVPSGQPIVMMADRQTVGGYAKLGAVCTVDLPLLAQKRPGDVVRFAPISVEEAQRLFRCRYRRFRAAEAELSRGDLW